MTEKIWCISAYLHLNRTKKVCKSIGIIDFKNSTSDNSTYLYSDLLKVLTIFLS